MQEHLIMAADNELYEIREIADELVAALEGVLEDGDCYNDAVIERCRVAIAKAKAALN